MAKRKAAGGRKRVALYLRVSTTGQNTTNQRRELEAVADRHGWKVVDVFSDNGVSGAKGRKDRPGLDALLKGVARRDFDMVAAWSVDRLGRSLQDLIEVLSDLHAKGVDLYLHQQGLDTSTPSGRAMYQMMGVFAEFERAIIRERVMSGLARAATRRRTPHVPRPSSARPAGGQPVPGRSAAVASAAPSYRGWTCLARGSADR
jgi:DNA invertase Pin-like site-specific DNA recombinase